MRFDLQHGAAAHAPRFPRRLCAALCWAWSTKKGGRGRFPADPSPGVLAPSPIDLQRTGGKGWSGTQAPHGGGATRSLAGTAAAAAAGREERPIRPGVPIESGATSRQARPPQQLLPSPSGAVLLLFGRCLGAPAGAPVRRPATASAQHLSGSSDRRDLPRSGTSVPPVDQVSQVWTPQRVWPPVFFDQTEVPSHQPVHGLPVSLLSPHPQHRPD
jgi:hypothetical protein